MEQNNLRTDIAFYEEAIIEKIKENDKCTDAILIRVEPELKAQLQKLADMDNRKLSDYVRLQLMKLVENNKHKLSSEIKYDEYGFPNRFFSKIHNTRK